DGEAPSQAPQGNSLREHRAEHEPIKRGLGRQCPIDAVEPLTRDTLGNEQHGVDVGQDERGCWSTAKKNQNEEGRGGANPDRRIEPESAAKKKLCRGRLARGIRNDETGNNKEYFDAYPAEPCEGRGGRV